MRGGRGCQYCKRQHTKCEVPKGSSSCRRCLDAGRSCEFDPRFRFKQVSRIESPQASRPAVDLIFEDDQVWLDTESPISFVYEDGLHSDLDATQYQTPQTAIPDMRAPELNVELKHVDIPRDAMVSTQGVDSPIPPTSDDDKVTNQQGGLLNHTHGSSSIQAESPLQLNSASLQSLHTPSWSQVAASPASIISQATTNDYTTLSATYIVRPPFQEGNPQRAFTQREVQLLHYFIEKLAPLADTCDPELHFTREVPRRLTEHGNPMMLCAICALSSRHQAIVKGNDDIESISYQDQCLRLLIDALSASKDTYDENLLATVVILRHWEELQNNNDKHYHLFGSSQLLNAISRFSSSGGLGEAASWWSLRQAIYVSLVQHQPLKVNLENFDRSSAMGLSSDSCATNVVVLIVAKMLKVLHSVDGMLQNQLGGFEQDLTAWDLLKPFNYRSVFYRGPDFGQGRPFPDIYMATPAQVIGMEYYHAAKILLLMNRPANHTFGFNATRERRKNERDIEAHLSAILGLAISNTFAENALFEAHHLLHLCGYCFRHPLQRNHALQFLLKAEKKTGWRMSHTAALLKEQWTDLDAPGILQACRDIFSSLDHSR